MTMLGDFARPEQAFGTAAPRTAALLDVVGGEVLYDSGRSRVRRVPLPDGSGTAICKEFLGRGAETRARYEGEVLRRLAGVPGVPRVADVTYPNAVVVFDDDAVRTRSIAAAELPAFALALVNVLAAVHARGVIHRDISLANILVAGGRQPILIDFDLATMAAENRQGFAHHRDLVGTLPYLAPEQTGRTGRSVDHRADLYAIGSVLYELVAGHPPFGDGDPYKLIHDLLVRVPQPLNEVDPAVPPAFSDIVARLLEKEPDRRYQSADGLARDLAAVCREPAVRFPLGRWDFPLRLSAPSRLVGREDEIAALRAAFDDAVGGAGRAVLVAGAPGVGKSALVNELRPVVATQGGWYVAGKADQFRSETGTGVVIQAVRGIGRLLLADSDSEMESTRERLAAALGPNAALITAALPEFALLLPSTARAVAGDDPVGAENRLRQALLDLLRAVVSPACPVVMFLDDLQWADPATLNLLDALVTADNLPGLLLVGAYREKEIDSAHPLAAAMNEWNRLGVAAQPLRLAALPPDDIGRLLAEMLRMNDDRAAELAAAIAGWAGGNPYDTVELINNLRRDGALTLDADGWSWDARAIGRYIGRGDVVDMLRHRLDRLPRQCADLLRMTACLGGEVRLSLLSAAADLPTAAMRPLLAPALQDGLLMLEEDWARAADPDDLVRFPHDRVQQAALAHLDASDWARLQLTMARRLAAGGAEAEAAEQYLGALADVVDVNERLAAATLFGTAARNARRVSNYATAERYLAAAADIWSTCGMAGDDPGLLDLYIERHNALYSLGRLSEADQAYAEVQKRCSDPVRLAMSTCVQVSSLTQRNNHRAAVDLGLDLLQRLGLPQPDRAAPDEGSLRALLDWADHVDLDSDLARPQIDDPRVTAVERLFSRLLPSTFFLGEIDLLSWMVLQCQRMWVQYGPSASLAASLSIVGQVTMAKVQDYATGYRVGRHVLAVSEARGYEPEGSVLRHRYALHLLHWAEPLENAIAHAELARDGLLRGGELQMASNTWLTMLVARLECDRSLESYSAEIDTALTFLARTGSPHTAQIVGGLQKLVRALRGEADPAGGPAFDDARDLPASAGNPYATGIYHICRSVDAALTGDRTGLATHSARAMEFRRFVPGYPVVAIHLLRGLGAIDELRTAPPEQAATLRAEIDECRDWLADRAAEQSHNFRHLLLLIDAERAEAAGDFQAAIGAFDEASRQAEGRERAWHRVLIGQRAARFYQTHGLQQAGRHALTDAYRTCTAWGAAARAEALRREHPFLRSVDGRWASSKSISADRSQAVLADQLDILAVMRAAEALNAETNLDRLCTVIGEQLTTLTGATDILLALRNNDTGEWFLRTAAGDNDIALPVDQAAERGLLPISAFRYVERTHEPLLVADATRDDRFSRDTYVARLDRCSLMAVPIRNSGDTRAIVMLTTSLSNGAFTADRLGTLTLIAGQLAVSLANALLYGSLEERVADRTRALAEQTRALAEANSRLELLSITDALTGVANRRRFAEVLASESDRAQASGRPIGVVLMDIDHFKSYNDRYGHPAGDECLRHVTAVLGSAVRGTDLLCRYGGEEFAVILRDIDDDGAACISERFRAAVAAARRDHADNPAGIVTVSVGAATGIPSASLTAEEVVSRADAALYRSKAQGRNQVTMAPPSSSGGVAASAGGSAEAGPEPTRLTP
ncbi:MAG TPA: diguanylate cyclase [Actinoplanes sp.]|nr:diguanylate cyclase [Actinoplanes sp.]